MAKSLTDIEAKLRCLQCFEEILILAENYKQDVYLPLLFYPFVYKIFAWNFAIVLRFLSDFFFHLSYLHRRVVIVTLTSHILFAYSNHVLLYFILVRYGYISVPVRFDWYIHCIELLIYKFCTVASACFRYNTYNIYIYIFHSCDLWLNSFPDAGTHNMAANIDCFELNPVFVWGCENIHFMAPMWGTRGQGNWNLLVTEKTGDFVIIFY